MSQDGGPLGLWNGAKRLGWALVGVIALGSMALADWPMLGGTPARNMANPTAKSIPSEWSIKKGARKSVLWSADLGTTTYGGVVVAGGKVFIGSNNDRPKDPALAGDRGVMYAFDAATGKFLWQHTHEKLPDPDLNDWPKQGIPSSPAVDGDRLFYVSNRAELVCLSTEGEGNKAKVLWILDMIKDLKVFPCYLAMSSPTVVGDLVFVNTGNGINHGTHKTPEPTAPSFIAVDKKTGKVVWQDASPGEKIMEGQWCSPCAYEINKTWQVAFPGGDGILYGFDAKSGKRLWKFDCNPKKAEFKPGGRGDRSYFMVCPVFHEGLLYISTGNNPDDGPGVGHLFCIDPSKAKAGEFTDLTAPDETYKPGGANASSGLVWHLGGKIDPKPEDGREVHFGRSLSTVSIADGLLYAAELDGFMHCLDAKTGKKYWEHDLKDGTWASPVVADGKVFMGTDSGDLYVFAHGKEKQEPTKIEMEQSLKAGPTIDGSTLYIHNGTALFAIKGK